MRTARRSHRGGSCVDQMYPSRLHTDSYLNLPRHRVEHLLEAQRLGRAELVLPYRQHASTLRAEADLRSTLGDERRRRDLGAVGQRADFEVGEDVRGDAL